MAWSFERSMGSCISKIQELYGGDDFRDTLRRCRGWGLELSGFDFLDKGTWNVEHLKALELFLFPPISHEYVATEDEVLGSQPQEEEAIAQEAEWPAEYAIEVQSLPEHQRARPEWVRGSNNDIPHHHLYKGIRQVNVEPPEIFADTVGASAAIRESKVVEGVAPKKARRGRPRRKTILQEGVVVSAV